MPLNSINSKHYDVVIVGAGVNGASAAQHISAKGYSTLLVDKGDFAAGASSKSSRMLHCGLRYFETPNPIRDFLFNPKKFYASMVMAKTAMETREEIATGSPDKVNEIELCFPIYKGDAYKTWQLDVAFRVLKLFSTEKLPLNYKKLKKNHVSSMPIANALRDVKSLRSVAVFNEYVLDWPERFCIDAILDALENGADLFNFVEADQMYRKDNRWVLELKSIMQPASTATVSAKVVVNMAGSWIDRFNKKIRTKHRIKRMILGTKGTHIAIKLPEEYNNQGLAALNEHLEPHYCLPMRNGLHYFGPTETVYEDNPDDAVPLEEEVAFLLKQSNHLLPGLNLSRDDVVFAWSGIRPLGYDKNFPKGKRSRELHNLSRDGLPNVLSVTAGPVMSHRVSGREIADAVSKLIAPSFPERQVNYHTHRSFYAKKDNPIFSDIPSVDRTDLRNSVINEKAKELIDIIYSRTGIGWAKLLNKEEIRMIAKEVSDLLPTIEGGVDAHVERCYKQIQKRFTPH